MPDFQPIPQGTNPPEHTTYRRALNKYFAPARMQALEPTVRRAASEQLEPLLERGSADMVREFASIVPVRGLAALLNLSDGAWMELLERFEALTALQDPAKLNEAVMGTLGEAMTRVVADRRAHPLDPDTDLVTGVLEMKVDGEPLSDDAVAAIGVQIFAAGHGTTTTDGMSGCLYHLATSPDDQAELRRDPSLIPDAIEEFLRLEPSGHEFTRHATEDVEIRGCPISSGDLVALNIASANRDEDEFPHAGACIIDRKPEPASVLRQWRAQVPRCAASPARTSGRPRRAAAPDQGHHPRRAGRRGVGVLFPGRLHVTSRATPYLDHHAAFLECALRLVGIDNGD